MTIKPDTPQKQLGRPAPPVPKTKRSINLDDQVWAALDDAAAAARASVSATINTLLRAALSLDSPTTL